MTSHDRKVELVRQLMDAPVWNEVIVPMITHRIKQHIVLLRDRSKERRDRLPDDYLVGRWDEADALTKELTTLVQQFVQDQEAGAEEERVSEELLRLATLGRFGPYTSAPVGGDDVEENDNGSGTGGG